MSIKDLIEKVKPFYTLILLLVVASIFFALGRLSALEERHSPISIQYSATSTTSVPALPASSESPTGKNVQTNGSHTNQSQTANALSAFTPGSNTDSSATLAPPEDGPVIGSKSGKKYYFPWCGTIKRVKPENQVPFPSITAARAAGYLPAGNCKGLK